jgi:hypothetical protein
LILLCQRIGSRKSEVSFELPKRQNITKCSSTFCVQLISQCSLSTCFFSTSSDSSSEASALQTADMEQEQRMLECSWLLDQMHQCLKEYKTLSYICDNADAGAAELLYDSCGGFSHHSLKLKAFVQLFNERYLLQLADRSTAPDQWGVDRATYSCRNVSACVVATVAECDRQGWILRTAGYSR